MSSHHQAKRPYNGSQPSITSYFPATSPTSQPTYTITPQSLADRRSPPLPASIQSNLLSVGMRVRKSVPEGYKTGTYSAFTLFQDAAPVVEDKVLGEKRVGTRPRARELTPFCGILKVGGMAQQQWGIYDNGQRDGDEDAEDEEELPALSQGSTVSNASTASLTIPGGANKRRFEAEDDEAEDEGIKVLGLGGRAIAVPRRMKKSVEKAVQVVGQENVGDVDFQDAEFLDYGLIGEGDEEMGGV